MGKNVKAVRPYWYKMNSNFKVAPYLAWMESGGICIDSRPLEKFYEGLSYHLDLPTIAHNKKEARLRFVEAACLRFDTFPDYLFYEIIPVIWDCWPSFWETIEKFFRKHNVKTAFFTSSQTADHFKSVFPTCNIFHMPEGIDTQIYKPGKPLRERSIDYLEYGRCSCIVDSAKLDDSINVVSSRNELNGLATREDLVNALADSKITIAMTRLDNQPEIADGIDTLTQRYWENMLSRNVMVGRAPQELIDLIGYNPVVDIDVTNPIGQIKSIIDNIEDYQELVDKNWESAIENADWTFRINKMFSLLEDCGYEVG